MFLSREIGIKLCQSYTKTYICKIYVCMTRTPSKKRSLFTLIRTEGKTKLNALIVNEILQVLTNQGMHDFQLF